MDLREMFKEHVEGLEGSFSGPAEASRIADAIPDDEFVAWALEHKHALVREAFQRFLASWRAVSRKNAARSAFHDAARELAETGDYSVFGSTFVVDDEFTRKKVAELTKRDCVFVAERYEADANESLMEAAFMRAVAKRLTGHKTVADVFTEDTFTALRTSITSSTVEAA